MTANKILLQHKYANVIEAFAKRKNMDLRQAMNVFYKSQTYQDMREGVSDMHCRSDEYLVDEILMEGSLGTDSAPSLP